MRSQTNKVNVDPSANKPDHISILPQVIDDNSNLSSKTASMTPDKNTTKKKSYQRSKIAQNWSCGNILILNNYIYMTKNQIKTMGIMIQHFMKHLKNCNIYFQCQQNKLSIN